MAQLSLQVKSSLESAFNRFYDELEFYGLFLGEIVKPGVSVTQEAMEERMIFEALAVKIHASWEVFIRDLMIDCLSCNISKHAKSMGVSVPQRNPSREVCEMMLTGTGTLRLGNATNVHKTAERRLVQKYNPFKEINKADVGKIDEFHAIRNYIAHQSSRAKRDLENIHRGYKLSSFVDPGTFLATIVYAPELNGKYTRLGLYINSFSSASDKMHRYLFPHEKKPRGTWPSARS